MIGGKGCSGASHTCQAVAPSMAPPPSTSSASSSSKALKRVSGSFPQRLLNSCPQTHRTGGFCHKAVLKTQELSFQQPRIALLSQTRWLGKLQGGFRRPKHSHRNTESEIGQGGRKPGRKRKEKCQTPETPRPCPDPGGFCIKALTDRTARSGVRQAPSALHPKQPPVPPPPWLLPTVRA